MQCITSNSKRELSVHDTSMAFEEIMFVFKPTGGNIGFEDSNVFIIFCSLIVTILYTDGLTPISLTAARVSTQSEFFARKYKQMFCNV